MWFMLNPSTADATEDDPTIRRVLGFSRREGWGRIEIVNLFAFRATDPFEISRADDPIGQDNDEAIRTAVSGAQIVVLAWGASRVARDRAEDVLPMLRDLGVEPMCFGRTKGGSPRHPLYLPADAPLVPFPCVSDVACLETPHPTCCDAPVVLLCACVGFRAFWCPTCDRVFDVFSCCGHEHDLRKEDTGEAASASCFACGQSRFACGDGRPNGAGEGKMRASSLGMARAGWRRTEGAGNTEWRKGS